MNQSIKLAGAALGLATAATAFADVAINDYLSLSGYAVAAYTETNTDGAGGVTDTFFDSGLNTSDSVKVALTATKDAFSGTVSLFYVPDAAEEAGILDAYASYTTGALTITGGKFLSYLGYEAFDAVNMTQLTYATISGIPGYHSGVKLDYAGDTYSAGVAVVDSIMPGPGFFRGDNSLEDGVGVEAMFSYTGIDKLTVFTGIAVDDQAATDMFTYDLWASYALTDAVTIAGEYTYYDSFTDTTNSWLAFLQYTFSDKVSSIFRISGADSNNGPDIMKYTVAPTYVISDNFSLRGEVSYDDGGETLFWGVQGVFKF